jgi:hypothetical protein
MAAVKYLRWPTEQKKRSGASNGCVGKPLRAAQVTKGCPRLDLQFFQLITNTGLGKLLRV